MAKMEHRLIELMGKKQAIEGRIITPEIVAEETDIHPNTIKNWLAGKITRLDEKVIIKLCRYFGVDMPQLVYIDWQGNPPDVGRERVEV